MDDVTLEQPPVPISCGSDHISGPNCTITLRCHDRLFRDAEFCHENGDKLFSINGGNWLSSWSVRRTFKDTNEKHILDVRHYKSSMRQWVIEDPQGKQLCLVKEGTKLQGATTTMQAQITAEDVVGGHVALDIHSTDHAGTTTIFRVEGKAIAEMRLVENNDVSFLSQRGLDRTAWKIRVAENVDLALILALAYARAYVNHIWRR